MPKGTQLDLTTACIAMMMCLDSGGERVTHTETDKPAHTPAVLAWTAWDVPVTALGRADLTTDAVFSEISRELAREVWGVSL